MLKQIAKWLAVRHEGWRVRVIAVGVFLPALVAGAVLIWLGISGWPAFGYLINFGGLFEILALLAAVVLVHGYIGLTPLTK